MNNPIVSTYYWKSIDSLDVCGESNILVIEKISNLPVFSTFKDNAWHRFNGEKLVLCEHPSQWGLRWTNFGIESLKLRELAR